MNDGSLLLDAIRANPDEDVPRLQYADWLEEHGPATDLTAATVEFIRLACPPRKQSHDVSRMPQKAYWWLDANWKRLVPSVIELHTPYEIGETVLIAGHRAVTITEHNRGPIWNRTGRGVWMKLNLKGTTRYVRRTYNCSVSLEFFKGFCTGYLMFSPWAKEIVAPKLHADQPFLGPHL